MKQLPHSWLCILLTTLLMLFIPEKGVGQGPQSFIVTDLPTKVYENGRDLMKADVCPMKLAVFLISMVFSTCFPLG
ncbi:hypothetical protein SAMN04488121_102361 [Chitinophaga filiformis]|uniref:Uncharacterized protein n=1 Tax=Chitinophaga filiformis TaxID=104663 RepID=A0A1G7MBT3_CHIFI|nr:hypothetical protein SAMN04488121_102361 [Chitinophaga filiformis]